MKKVLLFLTILAIVVSMTACDILGKLNDNNNQSGDFDTGKVTFTSAYQKAQSLGFDMFGKSALVHYSKTLNEYPCSSNQSIERGNA